IDHGRATWARWSRSSHSWRSRWAPWPWRFVLEWRGARPDRDYGCWLLTDTISPVIYEARSDARNTITFATSHGSAARPNASRVVSSARSSSVVTLARCGCIASDGATALTRTPAT